MRHRDAIKDAWDHKSNALKVCPPIYGSSNGESSCLSLLSVACVSHELYARKIMNEDEYMTVSEKIWHPRKMYI